MMNHRVPRLFLFILSFLLIGYLTGFSAMQPVRVIVDGQTLALDQPALMYQGRVMVPVRGVFESLGAEVNYDPAPRTIHAIRGQIELTPPPGASVSTLRPQISATFPTGITPKDLRVLVDGIDYTSQVQIGSNSINWIPPFDLPQGEHLVTITGVGPRGEVLRRSWNFYVGSAPMSNDGQSGNLLQTVNVSPRNVNLGQTITISVTGAPGGKATARIGNSAPLLMTENPAGTYTVTYPASSDLVGRHGDVIVTLQMPEGRQQTITDAGAIYVGGLAGRLTLSGLSPSSGTRIGQSFNVTGITQPNTTVTLRVLAENGILGTVFGLRQQIASTQTVADANGNFTLNVNTGNLSSGSRIYLLLQANNSLGQYSDEQQIELIRE